MRRAFSITELLIALSIMAVVAAIAIPRLMQVRDEARSVVADQIQKRLNHSLVTWRNTGGYLGSSATAQGVLTVLTAQAGTQTRFTNGTASSADDVYDTQGLALSSAAIRISSPMSDFTLDTSDTSNNSYIFLQNQHDYVVRYSPADMAFFVWSVDDEYADEDGELEESEEASSPAIAPATGISSRRSRPWRHFGHRHVFRFWWRR